MNRKAEKTAGRSRAGVLCGLAGLLVLSAAIRFCKLGDTDTRSDEVELIEFLQAGIGPVEYFKHIAQGFQSGRQMPLPRVSTCAYIRWLDLDVTLFNIRTPYAALGSLAPLFLVFLGRRWYGPRLGWILGVLGAISPFAVYWARVGHVYGFVLPFVTMTAALFVPMLREAAAGRPPARLHVIGATATSILGCYSHLSPWPVTGLLWLSLLVLILWKAAWNPRATPVRVWVGFAIWALSVAPWAISFLTASKDAWDMAGVVNEADPLFQFSAMRRLPFVISWGSGVVGSLLTFGLPALGLVLGWRNRSLRTGLGLVLVLGVLLFGMLAVMMRLSGGIYTLRYFTPLWLAPLILAGLGIHELAEAVGRRCPRREAAPVAAAVMLAGIVAHVAAPLGWIINLAGHPTPYTLVNRWMDANLPRGAPVVVDRYFEPSHEMRFHAPTNVLLTFTVPNEPLKNFLGFRWRDTVRQFMERYPDAAYLEMIKSYFYVPEVGGWDWPRRYFARHVAITNEPALKLRRRQLGMTEDFYADNTNRVIVELFYNTPEDMLAKARGEGRPLLLLYGAGWSYAKTQNDYRDWRIVEGAAELQVHNLTGAPLDANLVVRGVSYQGTKRVQSSTGAVETFPPNQEHEWKLPLPSLPPGLTTLRLTDSLWNAAHTPLLVSDLVLTAP